MSLNEILHQVELLVFLSKLTVWESGHGYQFQSFCFRLEQTPSVLQTTGVITSGLEVLDDTFRIAGRWVSRAT